MNRLVSSIITVILSLMFAGCAASVNDIIDFPQSITSVEVEFYSMGKIMEWELDGDMTAAWAEWASGLRLRPLTQRKIDELMLTDGAESYAFNVNDGELSFSFQDGGERERYVVMGGVWYRAVGAALPNVGA